MMQYSFELIPKKSAGAGFCALFCKLDVDPAELIYLSESGLLDMVVWEWIKPPSFGRSLATGVAYFVTASANDKRRQMQREQRAEPQTGEMTLRHMIEGHVLIVLLSELPNVEAVIEARILDIGQTYNFVLERCAAKGRTDRV
jgi:hypothetical protein